MSENQGYNYTETYDLGGSKEFIIGVRREKEVYYYKFIANGKTDVLNLISSMFNNSQTYTARDNGAERIYILNEPDIYAYFIE